MWVSVRVCLLYPLFTNMHQKKKKKKREREREKTNVIVNFACAEITTTRTKPKETNKQTSKQTNKTKQIKTKPQPHIISALESFAGK